MMKFFLLAAVLAVSSALELTHPEWLSFKQSYGKRYQNPEEEQLRFNIFLKNKNMIQEHNQKFEAGQVSYKLRINHLADLSDEEFKNLRGYNHSLKKSSGVAFIAPENLAAPSSLDWRQKGAVTPVKNQGQCGSCWAFSTTGSLEGQLFRKTGKLVSLSEQQLVDCSTENDGCNGGLMDYGFEYIKESGIESESAYPYEGEDERCRFKSSKVVGRDTGYVDIQSGSEAELLKAVASVGPISVAIDAGQNSFQFYDSGVYYEKRCSSSQLDHGVLLVGYGTENGQDYWLVKNSWGPSWGQSGYIKMARNKNNHCGIATQASYPLV